MLTIFIRKTGTKDYEVAEYDGENLVSAVNFPRVAMARTAATSLSKKERGSQVINLVNDVSSSYPIRSMRFGP